MSDNVNREYESDYANYVLNPDPNALLELVDLRRQGRQGKPILPLSGGRPPRRPPGAVPDLPEAEVIPAEPASENPNYGPGNPDWERDHQREDGEWLGVYPGHCINPETCRGYTHCPRNYSCVE